MIWPIEFTRGWSRPVTLCMIVTYVYVDKRFDCLALELSSCVDALCVWWNICHTEELTKLYSYRCGLNIFVGRSWGELDVTIHMHRRYSFQWFCKLNSNNVCFQPNKFYLMVFETKVLTCYYILYLKNL